jgi:hypothetical protein
VNREAYYTSIKELSALKKVHLSARANAAEKLRVAKDAFAVEAALPENSKAAGQPLRAKIEDLLKEKFGFDKGVYFGGDFQGPECRRLMTFRKEIFQCLKEFLSTQQDQLIVEQDKVLQTMAAYERLLGHLDAVFATCRVKRYHLQNCSLLALRAHIQQACSLWRLLGLSVTPKMHCVEDHLADIVELFGGVGDLGEDEGERGHQTGHRNEMRSKALRDADKKAKSHARLECMSQNPEVRQCQAKVQMESKRQRKRGGLSLGEANAKAAKLARVEARNQLLACQPIQEAVPIIKELRKEALRNMNLVHSQ